MKVYRGERTESGTSVTVAEGGGERPLDPRLDLRRHSPSGFNWGYGGSGPAQLALALAADALGDDGRARGVYQQLKFKLVAGLPEGGWTLTGQDVLDAVAEVERGRADRADQLATAGPDSDGAPTALTRRIDAHLDDLAACAGADATERESLVRERGWMEAVKHLAARGGLSHTGRVEAGKLVAASEDWLREQRGDQNLGPGR